MEPISNTKAPLRIGSTSADAIAAVLNASMKNYPISYWFYGERVEEFLPSQKEVDRYMMLVLKNRNVVVLDTQFDELQVCINLQK